MPSACLNFRELGFRPDSPGGFGEYFIIEEAYAHKIPDDWSGPVGLSVAMVCKTSGAKTIVAAPNPVRREFALKYGADVVLDPTAPDYYEQVKKATDGHGPSVIAEASGSNPALQAIFDIAGYSCRVNLIGHSIGRKVPVEIGKTIWSTLKIKGSGGTKDWAQRTIRFMSAIKDKYDFDGLNSHHIPFKELDKGMDLAVNHPEEAFKVMLTFDE